MAWDPRTSGVVPADRSDGAVAAQTSVELMARDMEREVAKRTVTASFPPPPPAPSTPPPALSESSPPQALSSEPLASQPPPAATSRRPTPITMPSLRPAPPVREDDEVAAALALFSEGAAPHETPLERARRLGFGKETLAMLAPTMVRKVARSTPPPSMKFRVTRELVIALALMIAILSSASVALALH